METSSSSMSQTYFKPTPQSIFLTGTKNSGHTTGNRPFVILTLVIANKVHLLFLVVAENKQLLVNIQVSIKFAVINCEVHVCLFSSGMLQSVHNHFNCRLRSYLMFLGVNCGAAVLMY